MDQVAQPVKIKKCKVEGKNNQCSKEKDVKSCFAVEHEKKNTCGSHEVQYNPRPGKSVKNERWIFFSTVIWAYNINDLSGEYRACKEQ